METIGPAELLAQIESPSLRRILGGLLDSANETRASLARLRAVVAAAKHLRSTPEYQAEAIARCEDALAALEPGDMGE